jgi:outer membrane lipoprotein-sorting protein
MFKQDVGVGVAVGVLFASGVLSVHTAAAQDAPQAPRWNLESALQQLSGQAEGFATAFGNVSLEWKNSSGAVSRSGKGTFYMNRDGQLRFDATEPEKRSVLVTDETVFVYEPARAIVEEFRISQHPERLEPFALLGFSSTGENLQRDYLVTLTGEEMQGTQRLLGFELTPMRDEARSSVARMNVWIDQASWMPVRQQISHTASGETLNITYSQQGRNFPLSKDLFEARWPKEVQRVRR